MNLNRRGFLGLVAKVVAAIPFLGVKAVGSIPRALPRLVPSTLPQKAAVPRGIKEALDEEWRQWQDTMVKRVEERLWGDPPPPGTPPGLAEALEGSPFR